MGVQLFAGKYHKVNFANLEKLRFWTALAYKEDVDRRTGLDVYTVLKMYWKSVTKIRAPILQALTIEPRNRSRE